MPAPGNAGDDAEWWQHCPPPPEHNNSWSFLFQHVEGLSLSLNVPTCVCLHKLYLYREYSQWFCFRKRQEAPALNNSSSPEVIIKAVLVFRQKVTEPPASNSKFIWNLIQMKAVGMCSVEEPRAGWGVLLAGQGRAGGAHPAAGKWFLPSRNLSGNAVSCLHSAVTAFVFILPK